jgi:hypothetical protein
VSLVGVKLKVIAVVTPVMVTVVALEVQLLAPIAVVPTVVVVSATAGLVAQDPAVVVTAPVSAGIAAQGKLVALLRLTAEGVPSAGVVKVGETVVGIAVPVPESA